MNRLWCRRQTPALHDRLSHSIRWGPFSCRNIIGSRKVRKFETMVRHGFRARRVFDGSGRVIDQSAAALASPKAGSASDAAVKDSGEMRLVRKAAGRGDLAYLLIAVRQQGTRMRKPECPDVGVRRHAEAELESPGEMTRTQPRHGGQIFDSNGRFEIGQDVVDHPSRLPGRESLNRAIERHADHGIQKQFKRPADFALRDVCILVESQVCAPEKLHGNWN